MHRDRKRHYGHREHRGGRDRDQDRGIESATRDETIGEETVVVMAASASVVGAVGGSSRNTDGSTIGARSVNVMMSVDIVVGAKTARLLVEAIEDVSRLGRQRAGRQLQRGVSCCRSADARPLDGTSMHWGTSRTRLCK